MGEGARISSEERAGRGGAGGRRDEELEARRGSLRMRSICDASCWAGSCVSDGNMTSWGSWERLSAVVVNTLFGLGENTELSRGLSGRRQSLSDEEERARGVDVRQD